MSRYTELKKKFRALFLAFRVPRDEREEERQRSFLCLVTLCLYTIIVIIMSEYNACELKGKT